MRALIQRVGEASVTIDARTAGAIGVGPVSFVCAFAATTRRSRSGWPGRL
jgi:D-Tyr-tRNAtyr deacylase